MINHAEPVVAESDEDVRERLLWVGPDDRGLDLEVMSSKCVAGPDIDLDTEVALDKRGAGRCAPTHSRSNAIRIASLSAVSCSASKKPS